MKVIAFGSIARVGKDSCAAILSKHKKCVQFSFAHELKKALDPLCLKFHKISAFTQDEEEKKILRPLLVAFGNSVRAVNHRAWIERLKENIDTYKDSNTIVIISDLRFCEREGDEFDFVKKELKGLVVNVDRKLSDGTLVQPANESESKNYPIIKNKADIQIIANDLEALENEVINKVLPLL